MSALRPQHPAVLKLPLQNIENGNDARLKPTMANDGYDECRFSTELWLENWIGLN
jgi:hypothetical protein